jgi:hypothetical protein
VAAAGSTGQPGQGTTAIPSDSAGAFHWVALSKDWLIQTGPAEEHLGDGNGIGTIGTDGSRVFTFKTKIVDNPPGDLTAYDAVNGKQLWQTTFQLAKDTVPVGANDVVILVSSKDGGKWDARNVERYS